MLRTLRWSASDPLSLDISGEVETGSPQKMRSLKNKRGVWSLRLSPLNRPRSAGSVMPHKGKRADTVGPFSILFTLPPGQTQALSRNRSALRRMSYFFFILLRRHGLFLHCARPREAKPSLADAQTYIRSEPVPQSKYCKKCLFFRILTDVQLHMNGSSEIDGRSLRKPCAPASSAPGDATMTLGDLV